MTVPYNALARTRNATSPQLQRDSLPQYHTNKTQARTYDSHHTPRHAASAAHPTEITQSDGRGLGPYTHAHAHLNSASHSWHSGDMESVIPRHVRHSQRYRSTPCTPSSGLRCPGDGLPSGASTDAAPQEMACPPVVAASLPWRWPALQGSRGLALALSNSRSLTLSSLTHTHASLPPSRCMSLAPPQRCC